MPTNAHRNAAARVGVLIALATASASTAPAATATAAPPQRPGGCHMVTSPSPRGLDQMMAHSSPTAAYNMRAMLKKFSPDLFCGVQ